MRKLMLWITAPTLLLIAMAGCAPLPPEAEEAPEPEQQEENADEEKPDEE